MRVVALILSALVSGIAAIVLAVFLWFVAAQNSSISRSPGPHAEGFAQSATVFYYLAWCSLVLGVGGGSFLLFLAIDRRE